ncbi:MAG: hypothetical protein ACYCS8_18130, partial [Acidithiobacillus sp.]
RAKWLSFDSAAVTIRTLFFHAKQYGWTGKPARVALPLPIRELPTDHHEPLARTVPIEQARAITKGRLADAVLNAKPFSTTAIQITVGVGKTSALKGAFYEVAKAGKTLTIVARDKKQCEAYEAAGAFWRHGRENTKEGFADDWHCPKAESGGNVERLASQEHRLQQMCKSGHCEHGNAYMRDKAHESGREPDEKIVRFFREKPEFADAEPCMCFEHMHDAQGEAVRVVTAAGLSQSDMIDDMGGDIDVLTIDEGVQWAHSQFLALPQIRKYIETLQRMAKSQAGDGTGPEEISEILATPIAVFADLAKKLGESAADAPAGAYQPIIFDIAEIAEKLKDATDDKGVALWEKPIWRHWLDLVDVPLRALAAIRDGIAAGSLSVIDGQLHVTYLHPAIAHARAQGIPIVIMDATLDATASAFADVRHSVVAAPNADWRIDPRWFKGAKNDGESLKKEAATVMKLRKKQEAETGHESFIICRRALALFMIADLEDMDESELDFLPKNELWDLSIDSRIGWFGWHDVAHDEWNGLNCLIWGQMPVPDGVRMQEYADHRAALMLIGLGDDLPLPDNDWASDQMIQTGTHEQQSMGRLPVQPEVRDWLLRRVSDQKIQAAGRSRAVCQDHEVTVWQIGGYPMTGLADHGIRPTYQRLVSGLSGAEVATLHAAQRRQLITDAAVLAVASGRQITRDNVREFAEGACKSLIANKACDDPFVRDGYIYIYQSRTKKEALDSKENKELQDVLFTDDAAVWDHEYAAWRETAHSGLRMHFAQDRDMPVSVSATVPVPVQEPEEPADDAAAVLDGVHYSPESENIFRPDPDDDLGDTDAHIEEADVWHDDPDAQSPQITEEPAYLMKIPFSDPGEFFIIDSGETEAHHE